MEAIRKTNPGAYKQSRYHYAADADSTRTLCGKDVAQIKGDRRGSWSRPVIERTDASTLSEYAICATCRSKIKSNGAVKLSTSAMKALLARAAEAGETAFKGAIPTPMVVYTPKDVLGSLTGGDDGGVDTSQPVYQVNEGVCGFGWVSVKPGGSRFARWLIKEGYGSTDSYAGGVRISLWKLCGDRQSQSLARWEAAAYAVAEVLREGGITAYGESRID